MDAQQTVQVQRGPQGQKPKSGGWLKKLLAPLAALGAVLAKFKAALIPLLKFAPVMVKTGGSMLLSVGAYAMLFGWRFALGFVILILIHECGHLVAAKRVGLKVGAPVFIPFMGAFIALKEAPRNAWIEAQVGIGGPILGAAASAICFAIYLATGKTFFGALAYTGFFLNLFNLAPFGYLDGGRIVSAISPWFWVVGLIILVAMMVLHFNPILLIIVIFSLPRLFSLFSQRTAAEARYFEVTPAQRIIMGLSYFGLIIMLGLGMVVAIVAVGMDMAAAKAAAGTGP